MPIQHTHKNEQPLLPLKESSENATVLEPLEEQSVTAPDRNVVRVLGQNPVMREALHQDLKTSGELQELLDHAEQIFREGVSSKDPKIKR